MMLRAEQTPNKGYLEKQGEDYNLVDWYLDVLRKHKDKLLRITRYVVADAWFSKAKFVGEACLLGFHVISRLRDDAALWMHMTAFAQASGDGRVSKARRLILRNSTFSVARFSTLKEEGLTQSRPIQRR